MKTWFILALAAAALACSAEDRICRRMDDLCGTASDECRELVQSLRRVQGDEGLKELARCYAEADSCGEAKGCEAALAVKGAASQVEEFFESFGKGLEDEERRRD